MKRLLWRSVMLAAVVACCGMTSRDALAADETTAPEADITQPQVITALPEAGSARPEADIAAEIGDIIQEEGAQNTTPQKSVGSFFDIEVPEHNYYFARSVVSVFGNKFGKQPATPQEVEEAVWDQLILSFVAFQQNVNAAEVDVDAEVDKILKASGAQFDSKKDPDAYTKWVKEKTNEPVDLFENQIRHLVQVQKLKDQVMQKMDPAVSDEEMLEGFLNENSSLDMELVKFDSEKDAMNFYDKVKSDTGRWDREKSKRPKDFKRPGGVTVQFLIDFWNVPGKTLREMTKMKPGQIHKPDVIYKGWGVYKVIGATPADESKFDEAKEKYREKIKAGKRYEGFNAWLEKLRKDANVKVYPKAPESPKQGE